MNRLASTHQAISHLLGEDVEPYDSVELVEAYRKFWKPERVRILLLAESHVFTSDEDRAIEIRSLHGLEGYPNEYARFVYCLGYGEKGLTGNELHPKQDGTPQFWKIFYSCLNYVHGNEDFRPVQKVTAFRGRLQNKVKLLKTLKASGIWLVDVSIVALYRNARKPGLKSMSAAIQASWDGYVEQVVAEAAPEHVIVIGKGVARAIGRPLRGLVGDSYTVTPQPQARLTAAEHLANYQLYHSLCLGA